jgi:hypothetical protein
MIKLMNKISWVVISVLCLIHVQTHAQINTPAGATVPFGSNNSYAYGILPTNLPTSGTYGKGTEVAAKYTAWKSAYIENCGTDKARVKFDNTSETVSEGIAYGMLLAAYAADQDLFNRLWAYYKQHRNAKGVMHWKISGCNSVIGQNGATDAELDAAMALIVANYQWPNTTSPHNYKTDAVSLINAIKNYEINATDFTFENGDAWKPACRNPSYQAPGYARVFKLFMAENGQANNTFWDNVIQKTENLLINNAHTTSGLSTNWCTPAGPPNSSCSGSGTAPDKFGYDACRAPWRQSTDYIWYGPSTILTITNRQAAFWIGKGGAGSVQGGDGVNHDGSGSGNHNAAFVGPIGALSLATTNTTANQQFCNALYSENKNDGLASGYFTKILQMLGLFVQTGNFWNPYAVSSATTTSVALTAPTVTFAAEGDVITVSATATATTGAISKVDFYAGTTLIGTDNSSPYSISWTPNVSGTVSITAKATNTNGDVATTAPFNVSIYKAVNQTNTAPTIDGVADGVWGGTNTSASLNNVIDGTVANASDLSANYKAMWDATYFYVLVNVTDNVKTNNGGTDYYNDDAVEVFFDIGNNKTTTYGANDFQYTFRWNDNTIYEKNNKTTGVTFARVDNSTGYVMEMRFPWSTLTGSPAINQLVGFDVAVNDDDDGNARDRKISWAATADQAWTNPSYMGTVILKGAPACTLPSAAGTITGTTTTCANAAGITYSIAAVTGATGYTWTVPAGATITAGANTTAITVTFGTTAGNVSVTPTNTCGNGTAATTAVTLNSLPSAAGSITGITTTCANAAGITYSIAAVTGATGYNWTVPAGATITSGTNTRTITVTFGTTGGNVSVTPTNTCGNGTAASTSVAVNSLPAAAGDITGVTTTCANTAGVTYSIAAVTGATGYSWTVPAGATITAGANTRTITVTFGTAGGNVTVTPTNTCGNGTNKTTAVTVNASGGNASVSIAASPSSTIYTGQSVTFTATPVNGGTPTYQWKNGSTNIAGATAATYTTTSLTNGNAISVTMTSTKQCVANTTANSNTITMTVTAAPAFSSTINGPTVVSPNQSNVTFSVSNQSGMQYQWTVPPGATIVSGANTNSIVVNFGTSGGNVTVKETNPSNQTTTITKAITVSGTTPVYLPAQEVNISVYPVPCNEQLMIAMGVEASTKVSFSIIDMTGNTIQSGSFEYNSMPVSIEMPVAAGIYQLLLQWDGTYAMHKIMKQ